MHTQSLPDAAGGFNLSLSDAASVLDTTEATVLDLVAAGCVYALLVHPTDTTDRPPVRFAAGLLAEDARALRSREDERRGAQVRRVSMVLRQYLTDCPPRPDYDAAKKAEHPVLTRDRHGLLRAHVSRSVIHRLAGSNIDSDSRLEFLFLPSKVGEALEKLGCERVKGLRPADGTKQRWDTWFRVPLSIWSPQVGDQVTARDWGLLPASVQDGGSE